MKTQLFSSVSAIALSAVATVFWPLPRLVCAGFGRR